MNIDEKLLDIKEYFRIKVITGDYEFLSCDGLVASIRIDGKYYIELWVSDHPHLHLDFFQTGISNNITTFQIQTNESRVKAWEHLKPHMEAYDVKVRQEKLISLQNEIDTLKLK